MVNINFLIEIKFQSMNSYLLKRDVMGEKESPPPHQFLPLCFLSVFRLAYTWQGRNQYFDSDDHGISIYFYDDNFLSRQYS